MQAAVASLDGVSVQFEARGEGGPAIVFVHGWCCEREHWRAQIDHFAGSCQVVAIDLAGHGRSGSDRLDWTMPSFGQDVVAVVRHLGLRQAVLIGHSMGGDVVVEAALRLPGVVTALVWVDVYRSLSQTDPAAEAEALERFMVPFRADFATATRDFVGRMFHPDTDPLVAQRVAAGMSARPEHIALGAMKHAISNEPAVLQGLAKLTVPVMAINPAQPPTDFESLARYGVGAVVMPGVKHFPMMEAPDAFNHLLGEVLEELS